MVDGLDRLLGRGSYRRVKRWLDPHSEYTQITYGRVLNDALGPSVRWLDAGCGHEILKYGAGTEQFDLGSKARMLVGCDLDISSLRTARQIKYRLCSNLEALPIKSDSFDVVSLNNVAEHLQHPDKVFAEIARVLRKGGRLIVHTPNVRSYEAQAGRLARVLLPERVVFGLIKFMEHREEKDVFPTVYQANTRERLIELASSHGMRVERVSLLRYRPLLYFVAPFAVIELLLSRAMIWLGLEELAAPVLLGVFQFCPSNPNPCGPGTETPAQITASGQHN
jgi:SAM-dependent methyltransferase